MSTRFFDRNQLDSLLKAFSDISSNIKEISFNLKEIRILLDRQNDILTGIKNK